MNKILLALGILGAGGGAFLTVRPAALRLREEAQVSRAAWQVQTQLLAAAQTEQARLADQLRDLRQALARNEAQGENPLWSALQTNTVGQLQADLREQLLEELGFDWQSSPDFIVVPKEALRECQLKPVQEKRLADPVAAAFAMTPAEREQVEAAIARVRTELSDWAAANTERTDSDPTNNVVARYTLASNPTLGLSLSNALDAELVGALGQQRAELMRPAFNMWAGRIGLYLREPQLLILTRAMVGDESRLKWWAGLPRELAFLSLAAQEKQDLVPSHFPANFLSIFPNGWADVAKREGFELPEESPEK